MTRKFNLRLSATAAAAAITMAGGAQAADVLFTFTEGSGNSTETVLTFIVPESPTANELYDAFTGIEFSLDTTVDYNGGIFSDEIFFENISQSGGLSDNGAIVFVGSQYYSGLESAPTFILGTYNDQLDQSSYPNIPAKLVISAVSSAPEPATWALMLVGFGGVGGALRARRRAVAAA